MVREIILKVSSTVFHSETPASTSRVLNLARFACLKDGDADSVLGGEAGVCLSRC